MSRTITVLAGAALAGTVLALSAAAPSLADGATHDSWPGDWEGSQPFAAGEGPCVDWAGTFHEARTGDYRILTAPGGRVEGEFHVNGVIDGHIDLVPDDLSHPTYSGDYREKLNAVITGYDEQAGDLARVAQYRLRVPLTGSDGSRFVIVLAGKLTTRPDGTTVVSRDTAGCVAR